MSKKIKVLVVPSDRTGVGYFRSTKPHITLENNYPDEFHVDIDYEPRINDDNFLKKYGGRVIIIKRIKNYSTTSIINKKND